jgi:glutamate-ammonia-ligase adenylyltransferase
LRTPASLNAIAALGQHGLLSPFEANTLASNYTFLRQVEHRLQVEGGQQVHALPHAENVLNEFARRMGYVSAQSFMAEYRDRAAETRNMLKRFLAVEGAGNLWIQDLLNPNSDGEEGKDQLVVRGFREVNKAREELINLYSGPSEHPYPAHVRRRFTAILPTLIQALSECSNPDESLLRVGLILSRISAPGVIYDIIQHNPSLAQILVTVVSNSEYLAEILVRDPGLFDLLGSSGLLESPSTYEGLEQQLEYLSRAHDSAAALYRLRDGETLRIGLRDLLERADIIEIGLELTQLAEICLRNALSRAREDVRLRQGPVHGSFAVFGLGKMGGCELGYGSDLDLLFVYSADASTENGMAASQYYALVASGLIRILKEPTRYGALYDIDARLRPDGNKGTLVATDRRIEEYYRTEAQAWERLALTKLRFVAGDEDFGKDLEQRLRAIAFDGPLPAEDIDKIEEVRGKIVAQANHLDIKKSEGGMAELEFAVRLLQMRHALTTPTMNRADVLGTLLVMQAHEILPNEDIKTLQNAYIFFRRVENRIRLATGLRGGKLPDSPAELASLAQKLNIDGNLMELFLSARSQVHAIYENAVASHRE